jgi:hypothetical protein
MHRNTFDQSSVSSILAWSKGTKVSVEIKSVEGYELDKGVGWALVPYYRGLPMVFDPEFLVYSYINHDRKPETYVGGIARCSVL